MKRALLCLMLLAMALVSNGCVTTDRGRATRHPVDPEISKKISENLFDRNVVADNMHKVLERSLFPPELAMFHQKQIMVDSNGITFNYLRIRRYDLKDGGSTASVLYDASDKSKFMWGDVRLLKIEGPFTKTADFYMPSLINKDYYEVTISTKYWGSHSVRTVSFARLDGAKVFAALVVRMAELSGNYNVQMKL